eukprot:scaffold87971_cov66-Phaeocystis_antarctica.AAC.5
MIYVAWNPATHLETHARCLRPQCWQSLLVKPLQRQSTDARVEHVERVHRLPAVTRRLGRRVLGAVSVLRRESAAHALDLVLEGHLGIVRVDALCEANVSTK